MALLDMYGFHIRSLKGPATIRTTERLLFGVWFVEEVKLAPPEKEPLYLRVRRCLARCSERAKHREQISHWDERSAGCTKTAAGEISGSLMLAGRI